MNVSAVGGSLSTSIATLATAQTSSNSHRAAGVAVMKMAQDVQGEAVLSLLDSALGVGRNLDVVV